MIRRYTFKLYPKPAQEAALRETASMSAQLWNALLQRREDVYRRERRTLSAFELGKEITLLRAECPEWAAMPRSIQERVCGDLDNAFKAFFRRVKAGERTAGYPRYKPTRDAFAIPLREMVKGGWAFSLTASQKCDGGGCDTVPDGRKFSGREAKISYQSDACDHASGGQPEIGGDTQDSGTLAEIARTGGQPEIGGDTQAQEKAPIGDFAGGQPEIGGDTQVPFGLAFFTATGGQPEIGGDTQVVPGSGADGLTGGRPTGSNWRLYLKCCPGRIRARGRFPSHPRSIKTADIKFHAGAWWLSVAVEIERERGHGDQQMKITFDLLDKFARVECAEGECGSPGRFSDAETTKMPDVSMLSSASDAASPETRADRREVLVALRAVEDAASPETRADRRSGRSEVNVAIDAASPETRDALQSDRDRRFKRGSIRWRRERMRIARLSAKEARRRSAALHIWTTSVIAQASALSVTAPSIQAETASGRGSAQAWGAAVEIKAILNRHILSMAPASAIQMLAYKAEEAGIEFVLTKDETPVIAVGNDLVATTRKARSVRAAIRKEKKNVKALHHQDADPGKGGEGTRHRDE